jgi:signal transduction histidine kinase
MMSIRRRFILITLISVVFALAFASWFLVELFAANFARRIDSELTGHINRLAGSLEFSEQGALLKPQSPADNRFYQAYGGLYWQINDPARKVELRSPSLFDYALPLPDDQHQPGTIHRYRLKGPEDKDVIVQERDLIVAAPGGAREVRIAVALDAAELDDARRSFALSILPYIAGLAVFLVAASVLQLMVGLKPVTRLANDVKDIHDRRLQRLPGPYPKELAGLAAQLNQLLDAQAKTIDKARARASDLAHGLKTPLTVISNHAYRLQEKGETETGDELEQLAKSMLAHVNHELARTRIAQSPEQRKSDAAPAKICSDIIRTLKHTAQGEQLSWQADIPEDLLLPIDPHDLRELMGNLLENASKWARETVKVSAFRTGNDWILLTEDDGPGVAENRIAELTRRGLRLDHKTPGTGLGLAIVQEIADVYNLELTFENRAQGGLRAIIRFRAET